MRHLLWLKRSPKAYSCLMCCNFLPINNLGIPDRRKSTCSRTCFLARRRQREGNRYAHNRKKFSIYMQEWRAKNPERWQQTRYNQKLRRCGLDPRVHNASFYASKAKEWRV